MFGDKNEEKNKTMRVQTTHIKMGEKRKKRRVLISDENGHC